jgi:hypothetical protein
MKIIQKVKKRKGGQKDLLPILALPSGLEPETL